MSGQWWEVSTAERFGCDELPCVDVGVGVYHHPYCGMRRDDPDIFPPDTPEDEEMLPPDPERSR